MPKFPDYQKWLRRITHRTFILIIGINSPRKRIEAWRLTVLSSAMPSDGDGEAGFTDTIRPHADYGSRLNPDCLQRLVPMLLRSRHKTQYRQPGFLTPAPCMEFEPPRHSPFFISPRRQSMRRHRSLRARRRRILCLFRGRHFSSSQNV